MAWLAAQAACLAPVLVCGYFLLKDVVVGAGRRANRPLLSILIPLAYGRG